MYYQAHSIKSFEIRELATYIDTEFDIKYTEDSLNPEELIYEFGSTFGVITDNYIHFICNESHPEFDSQVQMESFVHDYYLGDENVDSFFFPFPDIEFYPTQRLDNEDIARALGLTLHHQQTKG